MISRGHCQKNAGSIRQKSVAKNLYLNVIPNMPHAVLKTMTLPVNVENQLSVGPEKKNIKIPFHEI